MSSDLNGFANKYEFDLDGLSVLNLTNQKYNVLNWLAILLENRVFRIDSDLAKEGFSFIQERFLIDYKKYDVIIGYRADDSYFSFANAFLNNAISLEKLNEAMRLGMLGEQIALRSEKAFTQIHFCETIEADYKVYYQKKYARDTKARNDFTNIKKQSVIHGTYLNTILANNWSNDDVCLR